MKDWEEYYSNQFVHSFEGNIPHYTQALDQLTEQVPSITDSSLPKNIMLGGFHPNNGTPKQFEIFCHQLFPHPSTTKFFLDMNAEPFQYLTPSPQRRLIQSGLQSIPTEVPPLDLIFLDHTFLFMDDQAIRSFAENTRGRLAKNGLILALTNNTNCAAFYFEISDREIPFNRGCSVTLEGRIYRPFTALRDLTCGFYTEQPILKLVYQAQYGVQDLLVLSSQNSDFARCLEKTPTL